LERRRGARDTGVWRILYRVERGGEGAHKAVAWELAGRLAAAPGGKLVGASPEKAFSS
jgi:hypothetical protein